MKKILIPALAALFAVSGAASAGLLNSEEPGEVSVSGYYLFPGDGDFDTFKGAAGVQGAYREWFSFPWGLGVNAGWATYMADKNSTSYKVETLRDFKGECNVLPLGASLFFNVIDWDNWNLILGTGLEFLMVNSDMSARDSISGKRRDIDVGNALMWDIEAEYEYMLSEKMYILGGVGYQVDLVRAKTDCDDLDLRDTSFRGLFLRLGLKFLF
jgi:hypothetical protein